MNVVEPKLLYTKLYPKAKNPTRATERSAGLDLYALEQVSIPPHTRRLINTGLQMRIPIGYYGQITSRSGLSVHKKVDVVTGIVDNDFRGEVKVILHNHGTETCVIPAEARMAQIIVVPYLECHIQEVPYDDPASTQRGAAGFSTSMY